MSAGTPVAEAPRARTAAPSTSVAGAGARPEPPTVLVLGGSSAISRGIAAALARRGYATVLGGRDVDELERTARDLSIRYGAAARAVAFDAADTGAHAVLVAELAARRLEGVVVAFGLLGEADRARAEFAHARDIIDSNFTGLVSILTHAANVLERSGSGFIVALSSVAGDRGRQSNYVYGAAKAGVSAFLQGLRNRLAPGQVHVMTVKPGFVDTKMTWGLPGLFLVADPDDAGERIARALDRRRNVVYVPGFWRWIMLLIRAIPEPIFKRLKL